jgi:ferrochelatase
VQSDEKIAVVLLQLGGPDSLHNVEPFLYNLFSDPDIINLPLSFLVRRPLARFIAVRRAPKVREYYRRIGGRSPILKITNRQAQALETELGRHVNARVYTCMRYWHPMTEEIIDTLYREKVKRVVLLPLYPQYSKTTTGSSVNEWNRILVRRGLNHMKYDVVEHYCEHPLYISALVQNITIALERVKAPDRSRVHLVFSAHGTPVKLVKAGDPYQQQIIRTYEAVLAGGRFALPHHLCYQSKVGPEQWLEPSLDDTIKRLAQDKVSHVIVIPIAFVSDHSETLWEINIETRAEARQLGIQYFDMSPALNTNPTFIKALADVTLKKLGE